MTQLRKDGNPDTNYQVKRRWCVCVCVCVSEICHDAAVQGWQP
jgi:hypothetical protein